MNILQHILESDVIVIGDYYFVNFYYDSVLDSLILIDGHCVSEKKNKKRIRFDNDSISGASINKNIVRMFDAKGKLYLLELMELTARKLINSSVD